MPRRSKKHCHAFSKDATPDLLLVGSGNPSYRGQAHATAHPTCPCHCLVTLATRSPGRGAPCSPQEKNATVMLDALGSAGSTAPMGSTMARTSARRSWIGSASSGFKPAKMTTARPPIAKPVRMIALCPAAIPPIPESIMADPQFVPTGVTHSTTKLVRLSVEPPGLKKQYLWPKRLRCDDRLQTRK
jgi:hypothetical protein